MSQIPRARCSFTPSSKCLHFSQLFCLIVAPPSCALRVLTQGVQARAVASGVVRVSQCPGHNVVALGKAWPANNWTTYSMTFCVESSLFD